MQRRMLNRVTTGSAAPPPPPVATAGMPVVAPVTATPSAAGDQLVNIPAYLKGGAALNGVLPSLLEGSIPDAVEKLFKFWGFEPQLTELRGKLIKISLLYKDGEGKMYTKAGKGVEDWIDGVREAAYEMNDIIDDMNAEVLRLQVEFKRNKFFEYEIELKLRQVMQKLDVLDTKARRDHELKPASDDHGWVSDYRRRHKTTPSVDASAVYGLEEDLDKLVKSLLEPYVSDKRCNYSVVGIMGSGGAGKTTLAKLVLKDKRVVKEFSLRSWACVSDGAFNAERVLKDLYTYAKDEGNNWGFASLQKKVGELVMGKKFLFVLDDVWTDRDRDWEDLRSPFHCCGVGSIFLVTTRNRGVLDMMHSRVTHTLGPLANAHMWKLFGEKGFTERNSNEDLEKIGHDIVNKCKGVPLSAQVLGRMLHNQVDKRKWENVLESSYWDLPEEGDEDLPALRISHYHLPFHLKLCFEYLSIFPSDHKFDKRYLVQLWIGEGFVRPERGRYLEDIGSEYYEELQERSLIETDNKMHDLAHSLACKLSKKFSARVVNESEIDKRIVISARHVLFDGTCGVRNRPASVELHTCVYLLKDDYDLDASVFWNLPRLKYLHVLDLNRISMENMYDNFFSEFRHLRYLRLGTARLKKLPLSIHTLQSLQTLILQDCGNLEGIQAEVVNLVSLIHFDLSYTQVSTLPMWLCNLPCLRTLILFDCRKLREIPTEIEKLQTLRELDLRGTNILFLPDSLCNIANLEALDSVILPKFFGRLTQLKVLTYYYEVGIEEGRGIGELQNLRNLVSLRLRCLENVKSVKEAKMAALQNKKSLTLLSFAWNKATSIEEEEDEDHGKPDCEVLEALQPHPTKIESLLFEGYKGEEFPSWMRGSHFSSLKRLRMIGMERLIKVAQATFNSLKALYIEDCPSMEAVLIAAPMLEYLEVESCSKLRCLSLDFCDGALMESPKGLEVNNCANLWRLQVTGCHQLESLGNKGLSQSLKEIALRDCENLTSLLSSMHNHALLKLHITKCPRLESFGEQGLPHSLQTFFLKDCESLKSLPRSMPSLGSLQDVRIINCRQICLAEDWLPRSLTQLRVIDCPGLESFPTYMDQLNSLQILAIEGCPQLESYPDRRLPDSIERLTIRNCQNLRSLPSGMDQLNSLQFLAIERCPQLESFPDYGLPHSIKRLTIRNCQNLRSLPSGLPNVMNMTIEGCPKLQTEP